MMYLPNDDAENLVLAMRAQDQRYAAWRWGWCAEDERWEDVYRD